MRPGPSQASLDPFGDPGPLELGYGPENVHLELASRGGEEAFEGSLLARPVITTILSV